MGSCFSTQNTPSTHKHVDIYHYVKSTHSNDTHVYNVTNSKQEKGHEALAEWIQYVHELHEMEKRNDMLTREVAELRLRLENYGLMLTGNARRVTPTSEELRMKIRSQTVTENS